MGLNQVIASAPNAFPAEKTSIIYASAQQASSFFERLEQLSLADRQLLEALVDGLETASSSLTVTSKPSSPMPPRAPCWPP